MKRFLPVLFILTLTGCSTSGLYVWGKYEDSLYENYKNPEKVEKLQLNLEEHISKMEKSGKKVAPGLYAELGTLYFQAGKGEAALDLYQKEKNTWPESAFLMDALIRNLRNPDKPGEENSL